MNNEIILQSLTESFEVLKDSWGIKKEAIINCIVETEVYDGDLAMDMWLYTLKNNVNDTTCVYDVISRFSSKHARWTTKEDACKVILEHITKYEALDSIVCIVFGKIINEYSYDDSWSDGSVYWLPALMAAILLIDNTHVAKSMIKSMSDNAALPNDFIGKLLLYSMKYVEAVRNHINEFDKDYQVTESIKMALFSAIEVVCDKEIRAECTIAIISL